MKPRLKVGALVELSRWGNTRMLIASISDTNVGGRKFELISLGENWHYNIAYAVKQDLRYVGRLTVEQMLCHSHPELRKRGLQIQRCRDGMP